MLRFTHGLLGLALAIAAVTTIAVAQVPFTLSGTVFGGSTPLANAVVEALQDGTTTVVASSTTNSLGHYSLSLPAGTYDLRVTPPTGSGFGQETIQDVVVTADRQQDIVLLASATLSGTVRGYGGEPVSGATVFAQLMPSFQTVAQLQTNVDGVYNVTLIPGTYRVVVNGSNRPNAPQNFSWDRRDFAVSGTKQLDADLPVIRVSGTIRNSSGQPVQNARVQFSTNQGQNPLFLSSSGTTAVTPADGTYAYLAIPGTTSISVLPPSGSQLATLTDTTALPAQDTTRDYTLAQASVLSGVVRGYGGDPLPSAFIQITTWPQNQFFASTTADISGNYSIAIPPSAFRMIVSRSLPGGSFQWDRRNLTVGGSFDIQLPIFKLTGDITNAAGAVVAGSLVRSTVPGQFVATDTVVSASGQSTTGSTGRYEILSVAGVTSLTAQPPTGSSAGMAVDSITVSTDVERDLALPDALRVSGTVRGLDGIAVPGVSVQLVRQPDGLFLTSGVTNTAGAYDLPAIQGTVRMFVSAGNRPGTPQSFSWDKRSLSLAGPAVLHIDLPVARISGRVTDSNGVGVPLVSVQAATSMSDFVGQFFTSSTTTLNSDSQGRYSLLVLTGTGNVTIRPPSASGFANGAILNLPVSGNVEQAIVLQRPDTVPPTIVSGPAVVHLSDTSVSVGWTTDEPATSIVQFGIGELSHTISDNALSTSHSVTLLDLEPLQTYTYRVGSTDRAGNGPVQSAQAFFTTQPFPGDVTPPVITSGPSVVFVDQTTAIVQWTTDEPATSELEWGETPALGTVIPSPFGRFLQNHSVRITGLTPATTFFAKVRSADPDGNQIESGVLAFTTLTVPDTQAPIITAGPAVTGISDTRLTVTWTTDEPSTSGVSYNDGTQFFVSNDEAFVRQHSVTLTGLRPQTTYHITVSSRDAVGNGPTLGGPIDAVTEAAPDAVPPAISALAVEEIAETSAVVVWTTDEPATSTVRFGKTIADLGESRTDVTLAQEHRITLTGLDSSTTYYFTVSSTDAAGNTRTTATMSFTTRAVEVDNPPSQPGTPTASPNPSANGAFSISWNPATDDRGIAGYDVLRNGQVAASVGATQTLHEETGLAEGAYSYRVRARDTGGHASESEALVVVVDMTPPELMLPASFTIDASTPSGGEVTFEASAADNFDPHPALSCAPASGSMFANGNTTVNCSARDAAGNVRNGSFVVTVRDSFAPVVAVPNDIEVSATMPEGAIVLFEVSAADNVDPEPQLSCSHASGSTYPIGETTVTCRAGDAAGNLSDPATFRITVAGSAEQVTQTMGLIASFDLPDTTEQALIVKLDQALSAPNATASCNELNALINTTRAQLRSGRLTDEQAAAIISATEQIMVVQGCR